MGLAKLGSDCTLTTEASTDACSEAAGGGRGDETSREAPPRRSACKRREGRQEKRSKFYRKLPEKSSEFIRKSPESFQKSLVSLLNPLASQ